MRKIVEITMLVPALLGMTAQAQTSGKAEFEVASIKANVPRPGFQFAADEASGGPGTADPGMFRCSRCSLATLIVKAFDLQPYQIQDRRSLPDSTYELMAKIPAGATEPEFLTMLQNLLKDRFGLAWHFQEQMMKGYHLAVAKNGLKLRESTDAPVAQAPDSQRMGLTEPHIHTGAVVFGASAFYRAANQSTAKLARVLSDQTGLPVDDATSLTSKYDISLRWSADEAFQLGSHSDGAFAGGADGAGHNGHNGGGDIPSGQPGDRSGPTLFDALQQQLGLRLVPAETSLVRTIVIDRVMQHPAEN